MFLCRSSRIHNLKSLVLYWVGKFDVGGIFFSSLDILPFYRIDFVPVQSVYLGQEKKHYNFYSSDR